MAGRKAWSAERDEIKLGFFSFGKFLMYVDLDERGWHEDDRPTAHPLLRALLHNGFREPASEIGDNESVDPHVVPQDARQVVDADSSQILALRDVNAGRNLVIQGPPGTGKSQTITNLIAKALGGARQSCSSLKRWQRLGGRSSGVSTTPGWATLASNFTATRRNKKAVLAELRRTLLSWTRSRRGQPRTGLRRLIDARDTAEQLLEPPSTHWSPQAV